MANPFDQFDASPAAKNPFDVFDDPNYKPPTLAGEFGKGVSSGIDALQGAGYGLVGLAGDALGAKGVRDWGLEGYKRNVAEQQANAPAVGKFEDIGSLKDVGLYAAQGLGQLAPFAASSLVTGGAGGVLGRMAGGAAAKAAGERLLAEKAGEVAAGRLTQEAATKAAQEAAGSALTKSMVRGATAGAAANSIGTEQGLIYGDVYDQTGQTAPGTAALYGLGAGLLDVLPEAGLIGKLAGKQATKGIVREVLGQAGKEAATEGAQTVVERGAVSDADPSKEVFSPEGVSEIANAAVLGGLGGGVAGAGGKLFSGKPAGPLSRAAETATATGAAQEVGRQEAKGETDAATDTAQPQSGISQFAPQPIQGEAASSPASQPPLGLPQYSGPTLYTFPDGSTTTDPQAIRAARAAQQEAERMAGLQPQPYDAPLEEARDTRREQMARAQERARQLPTSNVHAAQKKAAQLTQDTGIPHAVVPTGKEINGKPLVIVQQEQSNGAIPATSAAEVAAQSDQAQGAQPGGSAGDVAAQPDVGRGDGANAGAAAPGVRTDVAVRDVAGGGGVDATRAQGVRPAGVETPAAGGNEGAARAQPTQGAATVQVPAVPVPKETLAEAAGSVDAPTPDVSSRTDEQLSHLSTNGKPGWKEAAQAEIARRQGSTAQEDQSGVRPGQSQVASGAQETPVEAGSVASNPQQTVQPEVSQVPKAGQKARVAGSDQERSHREWRENYDRVQRDPAAASTGELYSASNYAANVVQSLNKKAQRGEPYNAALRDSMRVEADFLRNEWKKRPDRFGSKSTARPAPTTEVPRKPPGSATEVAPVAPQQTQAAPARPDIDAETMETRHNAPQVAQPTATKSVTVAARTLNGPKNVRAKLYELPGYNGPQLAVTKYSSGRGQGYRVYLPKTGAMVADNNGVMDLNETLKLAVLRVQNARDTITKRESATQQGQPNARVGSSLAGTVPAGEAVDASKSEQVAGEGQAPEGTQGAAPVKRKLTRKPKDSRPEWAQKANINVGDAFDFNLPSDYATGRMTVESIDNGSVSVKNENGAGTVLRAGTLRMAIGGGKAVRVERAAQVDVDPQSGEEKAPAGEKGKKKIRRLTGALAHDLKVLGFGGLREELANGGDGERVRNRFDLSGAADLLRREGGYVFPDVNGDAAQGITDFIQQDIANGGGTRSAARADAERDAALEAQYRERIRSQAKELGIHAVGRKFSAMEDAVLKAQQAKQDREAAELDAQERAAYDGLLADLRADGILSDADIADLVERHQNAPLRELMVLLEAANQDKLAGINAELAAARAAPELNEEGYRDAYQRENAGSDEQAPAGAAREGQAPGGQAIDAGQAQPGFSLQSQTESELRTREEGLAKQQAQEAEAQRHAEQKAQADAEVGSFTLTGSDRAADVGASRGQGGLFDRPTPKAQQGEIPPSTAPQNSPEQTAQRFEAGKALTKEQRKSVLNTLVDVYKLHKAPKEFKGLDSDGNERYGYAHSPDLFEQSDITGSMVRYYVTMPDGRRAHPTELFPDYTQGAIDAELAKQQDAENNKRNNDAMRLKTLEGRKADSLNTANGIFNKQNPGSRDYEPAILTDGKQFIRTHPDNAENDLRLLGDGWQEQSKAADNSQWDRPQSAAKTRALSGGQPEQAPQREYISPSKVDTPAQGRLNQAKDGKKRAYAEVQRLRERIKNEPLGGNRGGLRLELMKAEERHREYQRMERESLQSIEERANELGRTTKKGEAKDAGNSSVSENARGAQTITQLRAELAKSPIGRLVAPLERRGLLKLHETTATAPEGAQRSGTAGFFDGKTLHLVAENLKPGEAAGVLLHEGWHKFLHATKFADSDKYTQLMQRLSNLEKITGRSKDGDWVVKAALAVPASDRTSTGRRLNELAAYAIQQYENDSRSLPQRIAKWAQDFIATVREWMMRKVGWMPKDVTQADLAAMARRYLRELASGEDVGPVGGEAVGMSSIAEGRTGQAFANPLQGATFAKAGEVLSDVLNTHGSFGILKGLKTQYHKATLNPLFKGFWERSNAMAMDSARAMSRPADLAPRILPKFDPRNMKDAAKALFAGRSDVSQADMKAVADALNAGTLDGGPSPLNGRLWSAAELTTPKGQYVPGSGADGDVRLGMGLTGKQAELYEEARAAVDASIDETAAATAWKLARQHVPGQSLREMISGNPQTAGAELDGVMEFAIGDAKDQLRLMKQEKAGEADIKAQEQKIEDLSATREAIAAVFSKAEQLKTAGYMPLMRFGKYRIGVTMQDDDGETVRYVARYESHIEANRARRELEREFPSAKGFKVGPVEVTNENEWKLYKGVNPETVMLFAEEAGINTDEVMQKWYREAVSNRSALRRMVHRSGVAGYSDDLPRVLASFITSNGKQAGYAYHLSDMQEMLQNPDMPGDVQEEAQSLLETIQEPNERGANMRGLMASWYLLGSVASAITNATQTVTMSLPWLSQFGSKGFSASEATAALGKAYKMVLKPITMPADLKDAMKRAEQEGIVDSNEVFHLYAESMKPMLSKLGSGNIAYRARAFMTLWGSPFAMVETLNRRATFAAAYSMARAQGKTETEAAKFAERAVIETQSIYAKHNRPNWARGTLGAAALTFKQYSISYLEMLARMAKSGPEGRKAALLATAILFSMAGLAGLPGEDDLLDIIDTVAQTLFDKPLISRMEIRNGLKDALGKELGGFVNSGLSEFLPIDVSSRLGLGNLIPGTAILKPSTTDKTGEFLEAVGGVQGSFIQSMIQSVGLLAQGNVSGAVRTAAPKAIGDLAKGIEMAATGEARDRAGRKIVDTDLADAFFQAIGFNPSVKAEASKKAWDVTEYVGYIKKAESEIVGRWARGIADNDMEAVHAAQQELADWNMDNPEAPIGISRSQIMQRVNALRMERAGRIEKMAPKELRGRVREMVEED